MATPLILYVFTVNPFVVIDDTFINPAVEPDIVAVTFGALANAVENVIANVPELVVSDPYKYLVILIDDTFATSESMPAFTFFGTVVGAQIMEVEGKYGVTPELTALIGRRLRLAKYILPAVNISSTALHVAQLVPSVDIAQPALLPLPPTSQKEPFHVIPRVEFTPENLDVCGAQLVPFVEYIIGLDVD